MHEPRAVLLSGENPTLPAAELRALLEVHDPEAHVEEHGRVAIVQPGHRANTEVALHRMALAHQWGLLWAHAPDSAQGLETLVAQVRRRADGNGSAAVVAERLGETGHSRQAAVERALGAALKEAGHAIDLQKPDRVFFAWLAEGTLWIGERRAVLDRSSHEARTSDDRAHFSPVSMHPRRAASLLHLARVKPGGRVLDPFCGTGALVLEAALEGYEAWGSDLDRFMVQGTMTTLTDCGPVPLDGRVFRADIADVPDLVGMVDGIVTDFPYGRASSSHDEGLSELYERAFAAFARLLPAGGHAVVGFAQHDLLPDLARHGFVALEGHDERMHKSLTRHFLVCKRTG